VFADRTDEERRAIKQKFAAEQAVAEAPRRSESISLAIIDHYTPYIAPNGFKAQIAAVSRRAAVLREEVLDRLQGPQSAVVDERQQQGRGGARRAASLDRPAQGVDLALSAEGTTRSSLIVCDLMLTGSTHRSSR
jgi:type I restriction enzyme R subunit